jgi:hypothetical protein
MDFGLFIFIIIINNFFWWYFFVNYRLSVKLISRRMAGDHINDIRDITAQGMKMALDAELQARANALYEAADLLNSKIEIANARKELLERRNKALEQLNG